RYWRLLPVVGAFAACSLLVCDWWPWLRPSDPWQYPIYGCGLAAFFTEVAVECRLGSWDPVVSAGYLSAFSGVLAGLVIAAIVVLLSDRNPNPERVRAVTLLTGGLFALIVDGLLFAIVAGDTVCARAWAMTTPAASLLGVGVLGIFGGIASLIHA